MKFTVRPDQGAALTSGSLDEARALIGDAHVLITGLAAVVAFCAAHCAPIVP